MLQMKNICLGFVKMVAPQAKIFGILFVKPPSGGGLGGVSPKKGGKNPGEKK